MNGGGPFFGLADDNLDLPFKDDTLGIDVVFFLSNREDWLCLQNLKNKLL